MTLKLPYKKYPLADGGYTYSAAVNVNIALPAKNAPRSKRFEAIVDSGASRCIFHASIGKALGFEIEKGIPEDTLGVNGPSRYGVIGVLSGLVVAHRCTNRPPLVWVLSEQKLAVD